VLLMDGAVQPPRRAHAGDAPDELLKIWGERHSTVILVTTNVDEAILLADRIYPMTPRTGRRARRASTSACRAAASAHMSLTPAYQKARQGLVEFLRACRPLGGRRS